MKRFFLISVLLLQVTLLAANNGGRLMKAQKRQENTIRSAYKRGRITVNEYNKLMNEQQTIKRYIHIANADRYWNRAEIARVGGKLDRAEKRLRRYKTNWED